MDTVVDVVVIGAGQAGVPIARALGKAGKSTVLIERRHLGGSCVNFGCTPSKGFIASSRMAYQARRAAEYGIGIPTIDVNFPAVIKRARGLAEASRTSLEESFAKEPNPRVLMATARLNGRENGLFRIETDGGESLLAARVVLNTGTREAWPDIEGLDTIQPVTGGNWLGLDTLPAHLIFIGAGAIAIEMAQAFRRLGSDVTIVEQGKRILAHEDADIAAAVQEVLAREGIAIHTGVEAQRVEATAQGVRLYLTNGQALDGSHLFLATGRQANTGDLGLETIGLEPGAHGNLSVDRHLKTSVEGVYAAGDIRGGGQFTNTAYDDFVTLQSQLLEDGSRTTERALAYAIFADPELGRVGLSEDEAAKAGAAFVVGRYTMSDSGKARELGKTDGFIKVVIEKGTCRILGAACLCENGSEVVQLFTQLIGANATADVMMNALAVHPTLGEAAKNAVASVDPR